MLENSLLYADVMHKRLKPKINQFVYKVYYLCLPLSKLDKINNHFLSLDKFNFLSFYNKDHGARDGSSLEKWIRKILKENNIKGADGEVVLLTYPRVLGYVFNPVSFWFCLDKKGDLRAILAEVNNTFGESHNYLIAHEDCKKIEQDDWLEATKVFHVSPFYQVKGKYKFRFAYSEKKIGVWLNYFTDEGEELKTSVAGKIQKLNSFAVFKAFMNVPLVTIKTIFLIHFQALILLTKKAKYIRKPPPPANKISR